MSESVAEVAPVAAPAAVSMEDVSSSVTPSTTASTTTKAAAGSELPPSITLSESQAATFPFTSDQFTTALQVLLHFKTRPEQIKGPELHELRKGILQVAKELDKNHFEGLRGESRRESKDRKRERQERAAREHRLKSADAKYINSVSLRSQRIQALNKLIEPQGYGNGVGDKLLLPNGESIPLLTAGQQHAVPLLTAGTDTTSATPTAAPVAATPSPSPSPSPSPVPSSSPSPVAASTVSSTPTSTAAPVTITSTSTPLPSTIITLTSSTSTAAATSKPYVTRKGDRQKKAIFDQEGVHINTEVAAKAAAAAAAAKGNVTVESEATSDGKTAEGDDDGGAELNYPRSCYCCKARYHKLHHFYDQFCPTCAKLNWTKRNQTADLKGRIILLTGSRVKIGFRCGLRLLRCGATVIATSRFPHDTAKRYSQETDFADWKDRLHIYGLDLRDLRSVVKLSELLNTRYSHLDGIVNNAAQTVRRPPIYYRHLMPIELLKKEELPEGMRQVVHGDAHVAVDTLPKLRGTKRDFEETKRSAIASSSSSTSSATLMEEGEDDDTSSSVKATIASQPAEPMPASVVEQLTERSVFKRNENINEALLTTTHNRAAAMSQVNVLPGDSEVDEHHFPIGKVDVTGQQLDLRPVNSWMLLLETIDPSELVEVFAINALSPFILDSRLKPLLMRAQNVDKWIINVSAMEGKFYRHKSPAHPHTNMAKAALNMLTRTSAQDYAKDRIYMNSVDTGWINDENPYERSQDIAKTNFQTPIDEEDAMARILDPVTANNNNNDDNKHNNALSRRVHSDLP